MSQPVTSITANFAVPFIDAQLPDQGGLNDRVRDCLLAAEKPENQPNPPTPTLKHNVFESRFDLFGWQMEPIQSLKQFVIGTVVRSVKELNGYTDEQMAGLFVSNHSWFHITRYGGYASGHNHPMASWSSVYCVDPGDSPPDYPDSGVLRFADPRPHANMYLDPANMHVGRPYQLGSVNYSLRAGQLIIFPSWLFHEVAPYFGDRPRITIASNYWFKER